MKSEQIKKLITEKQTSLKALLDSGEDKSSEIDALNGEIKALEDQLKVAEDAEATISRVYEAKEKEEKEDVERSHNASSADEKLQALLDNDLTGKLDVEYEVIERDFTQGASMVGSQPGEPQKPDYLKSIAERLGRIVRRIPSIREIPAIGGGKMVEVAEGGPRPNQAAGLSTKKAKPKQGMAPYNASEHALRSMAALKGMINADGLASAKTFFSALLAAAFAALPAGRKKAYTAAQEIDFAGIVAHEGELADTTGDIVYFMNRKTMSYLRGVKKDEGSGRYICENGEIDGSRIVLCSDMPDYAYAITEATNIDFYQFGNLEGVFDNLTSPGTVKTTYIAYQDVVLLNDDKVFYVTGIKKTG